MGEGGAGHLRALGHREEPRGRGCPQPSHVDSAAPPLSPSLAEGVTGDRMGAEGTGAELCISSGPLFNHM